MEEDGEEEEEREEEEKEEEEEEEEKYLSTQIPQTQKHQLIDLQDHLEGYCNCIVLPVFDFSGARYEITLIKSFLMPLITRERGMEPK